MPESRLVPCNLLAWPVVRDLLPDQKLLVYHLWATCPSACGCYLVDLAGFQGALSLTSNAVQDALNEFSRRGLLDQDLDTGEVFISAWYRWHKFDTAPRRRLLEDAVKKVESSHLKALILEKSKDYLPREGKEREGKETTTTPTPPAAGGGVVPEDVYDLRQMLRHQAGTAARSDPARWVDGALRRLRREGLDDDTAAQLADWRAARQRVAPDTDTVPETRGTSAGLRRALAVSGQQEYLPQASRSTV